MKITITVSVDEDIYDLDDAIEDLTSALHRAGGDDISVLDVEEPYDGPETNVQFFERVSDTAPKGGAMTQAFALDAIEKQAKKVLSVSPEEEAEYEKSFAGGFISWSIWKAAATDWLDAFNAR